MNIQFYMQFFPIENDAFNRQPRALCEELARRGHQVTVISDDSWLKTGDKAEEYHEVGKGSWRIYRVPTLKNMKASLVRRLRTYTGYARLAYAYGIKLPKPDCIYASMPSFFTGLAAVRVARKFKCPLVVEVRDLWPDDLVARKLISPLMAFPMYPMVDRVYKKADRLISLTPGIKKEIIKHKINGNKIDVIPVGCDKDLFADLGPETRSEIRRKYNWGDDFVAVYPGTHTEATALDVAVKAANELKDLPNFRMAFFGQGQTKELLKKMVADFGLTNVEFHDPVGKKEVAKILKAADAGLLNLQQSPIIHIFFENKFQDYLMAGLPIYGALEGDQADIVNKYNFGGIAKTGDFVGLAKLLRDAVTGTGVGDEMKGRMTVYAEERLLMTDMINHFADRIEETAAQKSDMIPFEPNL